MKVLIVDDDVVWLNAMTGYLTQFGYEVYTARDGVEALSLLEKETYQLIISDIIMPQLSGLGLLSMLKNFYYNSVPVVLYSGMVTNDIILSAYSLGAKEVLFKPFTIESLPERIDKWLH